MTNMLSTIRKALAMFAILGIATFMLAACLGGGGSGNSSGGGGGGGEDRDRMRIDPPVNRAPVRVSSFEERRLKVGESVTIDLSRRFTDPDGDSLTYSYSISDQGETNLRVSISGDRIQIQGVAEPGAYVGVTASDPDGLSAEGSIRVSVSADDRDDGEGSRAPRTRGSIPDQTLTVGGTVTIDLSRYFTDPDGDRLTYDLLYSGGQANQVRASVSGDSLRIQGVTPPGQTVRVVAYDPSGRLTYGDVRVTVQASPSPSPSPSPTRYGAYAYGVPSGERRGYVWAFHSSDNSAAEALTAARNRCAQLLGSRCQRSQSFANSCAAIAVSECPVSSSCRTPSIGAASGYSSRREAETAAIALCERATAGASGVAGTCDVDTGRSGEPGSYCVGVE